MSNRKGDGQKVPYRQKMIGEAARTDMSIGKLRRRRPLLQNQICRGRHRLKPAGQQRMLRQPGIPEDAPRFALTSEEAGAREAGIELAVGDSR